MSHQSYIFQSLFFQMLKGKPNFQSTGSPPRASSRYKEKQMKIHDDLMMVGKSISSPSSNKISSLYQNKYLNDYKNYIIYTNCSKNLNPDPISINSYLECPRLCSYDKKHKKVLPKMSHLVTNDMKTNKIKTHWRKHNDNSAHTRLGKEEKVHFITDSITLLTDDNNKNMIDIYKINDMYHKKKFKPFII